MPTPPVVTVTGWSNSGKTTYLTEVVQILSERGLSVAVIKHHGHAPGGVDQEGKDSWKYARAGANPVILSASSQYAVFVTTPEREATRAELVSQLPDGTDLVIVEGFHAEAEGAVELYRRAVGKPPKLTPAERIAVITDDEVLAAETAAAGKPVFALDAPADFATWLATL